MDNIKAYCNAIVNQILSPKKEKIKSIVMFIGAGCSSEYGIPTTFKLAMDTLLGKNEFILNKDDYNFVQEVNIKIEKYKQSKNPNDDISQNEYDDIINLFIKKYKELDINSQRNLMIQYLEPTRDSIAYKILANLWDQRYIDIVFTTNFDNLIEDEVRKIDKDNSIVIYNYKDLENLDYSIPPNLIVEKFILIRLAGDFNQNIMLWSDDDFTNNISKSVQETISKSIHSNPLVLIGYNANENEFQNVLEKKVQNHLSIVNNGSLGAGVYNICQSRDSNNTQNIPTKCLNFFQELIDTIYIKTEDTNLIYSFQYIKQEIENKIHGYNNYSKDKNYLVRRQSIDIVVKEFIDSDEKILIFIGDSGNGKSYYLQFLSIEYNSINENSLFIYIEASWLTEKNNLIEDVFDKLNISFEDIKKFNNKQIVFVIDGLNESQKSLDILSTIHNEVSQPYDSNVKFIISTRTDFWKNISSTKRGIEIIKKSNLFNNEKTIDTYNSNELKKALKNYDLKINLNNLKNKTVLELIKSPLYLSLIDRNNITNLFTPLSIFESFFESEISEYEEYLSLIEELCILFLERQDITIKGFQAYLENEVNPNLREFYEELVYKKILKDIRKKSTTFFYDKMGEYLFAKVYLQFKLVATDLDTIIKEILENIDNSNNISFKIFLINALRYFLALLDVKDIKWCLNSNSITIQNLMREALSEIGKLDFENSYSNDPFLFSICLQDQRNHQKIHNLLIEDENIYLSLFPINTISSKEPSVLKSFIIFSIDNIKDFSQGRNRNSLILIFNSILIYIIKNGLNYEDTIIFKKLIALISKFDGSYISSIIENVLSTNLKYLLYGSNGVLINEFFEIANKDLFEKAINESILELNIKDIQIMIQQNMTSWMITMMIFFRDRNHQDFKIIVDSLFNTGRQRFQDFILTLLGHLSKFDKSFLALLQKYTYDMKNNYQNKYNAKTIDNDQVKESQYDPMVPLISTNIFYSEKNNEYTEINLENIFMEISTIKNENDANNLYRLLYKIAIDYPYITLQTIYEKNILEDNNFTKNRNNIIEILNAIKYYYPDIFWEETKKYNLDYIFVLLKENHNFDTRTFNQIHDWHWYNIFHFIFSNNETIFNTIIQTSLKFNSFHKYIKSLNFRNQFS